MLSTTRQLLLCINRTKTKPKKKNMLTRMHAFLKINLILLKDCFGTVLIYSKLSYFFCRLFGINVCPVQHMHLFVLTAPNYKTLENVALQDYKAVTKKKACDKKINKMPYVYSMRPERHNHGDHHVTWNKGPKNKPF